MKQTNGVIWVVERKTAVYGTWEPMLDKVAHSRGNAKYVKTRTQAGWPAGTKFRVAKYVREGEAQ